MTQQISFSAAEFADNPEPRCACLLLLDVSGSMAGTPMAQLNEGLRAFRQELLLDPLAMKRVEVGIVSFGPVTIEAHFTEAGGFIPPALVARTDTPMGEAITRGIEMVRRRKEEYRTHGIAYYRPWIFLITDGAPTDGWAEAAEAVQAGEETRAFAFFSVGVQGANMAILEALNPHRAPLKLQGLQFRELFTWLSGSLKSVSRSTPGTELKMDSPRGWAVL